LTSAQTANRIVQKNDGNGRLSRLLTLLVLYRSGYIIGKYLSIEAIIEKSKETYYERLDDSSVS
jgi:Fic family protein